MSRASGALVRLHIAHWALPYSYAGLCWLSWLPAATPHASLGSASLQFAGCSAPLAPSPFTLLLTGPFPAAAAPSRLCLCLAAGPSRGRT